MPATWPRRHLQTMLALDSNGDEHRSLELVTTSRLTCGKQLYHLYMYRLMTGMWTCIPIIKQVSMQCKAFEDEEMICSSCLQRLFRTSYCICEAQNAANCISRSSGAFGVHALPLEGLEKPLEARRADHLLIFGGLGGTITWPAVTVIYSKIRKKGKSFENLSSSFLEHWIQAKIWDSFVKFVNEIAKFKH